MPACKNCQKSFTIEPDDFGFYEKIKVPPPTWCPECRAQRRFLWRNERTLYKRSCDLFKKNLISIYASDAHFPVYCHDCWNSDKWDPMEFGMDYDASRPFFEQLKELQKKVPRLAIWVIQSTNSEYTNQSYSNKNVYLSFGLRDSEDVGYVARAVGLKNCFDDSYTHHSEYLYQTTNVDKSYRSKYLQECEGVVESAFLSNSRNATECFGGVNLRSAQYVYMGEQLSKQVYEEKMKAIDLGSRKNVQSFEEQFEGIASKAIYKYAKLTNCVNVQGDHVDNAKNCFNVFDGFELENARHSMWVFSSKEISDCFGMGSSEYVYETISCEQVNNIKCCVVTDSSNYVEYTDSCQSSSNLFGCIGLRMKEYCILNKQYDKIAYQNLVERIKKDMGDHYGEFFPAELAPFAYNESTAQEYYPLTKEEAIAKGYRWKDTESRHYEITMPGAQVPDNIKDVDSKILQEIIGCNDGGTCVHQCTTAFKITPAELQFYQQMHIPLPILCPNCRHYQRLAKRNPLKLWHRTCMCNSLRGETSKYKNTATHFHDNEPCPNEFETTYPPPAETRSDSGGPATMPFALGGEIVYCEQCYQQEVI